MENKAIILVAGMGTRLKPRTLSTHKCLTKVNGIPIIKNALEKLSNIGVVETILVVGYLADKIRTEIGTDYNGMNIYYVENEMYSKTNTSYSLKKGLEVLSGYDVLYILEGDVFFEEKLLKKLSNNKYENITLIEPYNSQLDGTFVAIGNDGFVKDWIHKTMQGNGYSLEDKYKTINIHKVSRRFVDKILMPKVIKICNEVAGKAPLEYVMREIVRENGNTIYGLLSNGCKWFEIDDENDLNIAERMFIRG